MIAVVTGGSGFIGQNLIRRLLRDGSEVRCLVRPSGGTAPEGVRRYVVQLDQPKSLLECAAFEDADAVFHLGGATKATRPSAFVAANVTPTRHLLGALCARRLSPRFVFVSSQAAAGPAPSSTRAVEEDDPPRPVEAYGRSKLEAERIVESFSDRVPTTVVRPCAVMGPHDRDFLRLFRLARRGVLVYPGIASHWLSILYVDDVVSGLLRAAHSDRAISRTYFLASSEPVQWRTIGGFIAQSVGGRVRHVDLAPLVVRATSFAGEWVGRMTGTATIANRSKAALSRHPYWVCSSARARSELDFRASVSLPDAVRETYLWYRQTGWLRGARRSDTAVA
jgi:nucleoside-diphosphate-sugar epimerase